MKSLQSLKSKLIILLIGVVLLTTILLGAFQYFFVMKNYETLDLQRRALLEDNILKLMKATDSVYQMVEAPIEKESQVILARMVADYNQKGLSGIDLHDYYDEESGLELYIIDQSDTVIAATYKPDIGLNFSKFAGVDEFLDGIRDEGKFFSDRLSLSSLENIVMKYSYLPTPDGMYIFETGSPIDKDKAIPDVLSFGDFGDSISKNQGFVVSALLFSKYGVTFNEDVSEVKQINPSFKHYYNKALDTLQPVTFEGTYDGQAVTIKYLPFSFAGAGDLHEHTVIELIYSNADLQKSKNQVILLMLLTILLGSGLIAALAVRMSTGFSPGHPA